MRKIFLLSLLFVFSFKFSWSQQNPRLDKQTYFAILDGSDDAVDSYRKAQKYYRKGQGTYDEALKYFLKVYEYNPKSDALNYKIGVCYLLSSKRAESLSYFLNCSPDVTKDYYLLLGRAYQYNSQYNDAKESYNKYLGSLKTMKKRDKEPLVNQLISECDYSSKLTEDSLDVFIINLGPVINSYYDDYNAFLPPLDSFIYFTTKRPEKEPKKRVSRFKFPERIYMATNSLYKPCEWASMVKSLNNVYCNVSVAGIDKYEHRLFFYEGKWNNGRLLMTKYNHQKGQWKQIKRVKGKINHIAYAETSIVIGPDNTAYFISNRRNSVGGKDIWVAPYKRNDRWGKPYNIGDHINTPFDEEGIYISDDGQTLYFSSKGHAGMGGFDVYKCTKKGVDNWSEPVNMGYPINSPADELFYHETRDTMIALYSTIRADGYGGLDIYKIKKDPRIPFTVYGIVTDEITGEILDATVSIIDNETQKTIASVDVDLEKGMYEYSLEDVGNYSLQVSKSGYHIILDSLICPKRKHDSVEMNFTLDLIKHPFTLSGIITDVDTKQTIEASLIFKDANSDTIYVRQYTDSLGYYSITFDDKYNMVIQVEADNYYEANEPLDATKEMSSIITKNIELKTSKVYYNVLGVVTDESSNEYLYSILSFYRHDEETAFKVIDSDTVGRYAAQLEESGPFFVEVAANGYFFVTEPVTIPEGETSVTKNFKLKKMSTGAKIVVENILFNTGKSTLKPESFKELNKLAIMLIRNPEVHVEVSGHTDNVGSASLNKKLSKARALTVKNYLVSRGVEDERMEYEGYGFDQPIAPNDTPEGRAQNRRVEIQVIE